MLHSVLITHLRCPSDLKSRPGALILIIMRWFKRMDTFSIKRKDIFNFCCQVSGSDVGVSTAQVLSVTSSVWGNSSYWMVEHFPSPVIKIWSCITCKKTLPCLLKWVISPGFTAKIIELKERAQCIDDVWCFLVQQMCHYLFLDCVIVCDR